MYTNTQIEAHVSKLNLYQIETVLIEYYSKQNNNGFSIYNRLNNRSVNYDSLHYELSKLIKSNEIDIVSVIIEINS